METYEPYETSEDREKELSDAKHKGYIEGRNQAQQEWKLSEIRWERFRNAAIWVAVLAALSALTFLWIVPAVQDNMCHGTNQSEYGKPIVSTRAALSLILRKRAAIKPAGISVSSEESSQRNDLVFPGADLGQDICMGNLVRSS